MSWAMYTPIYHKTKNIKKEKRERDEEKGERVGGQKSMIKHKS